MLGIIEGVHGDVLYRRLLKCLSKLMRCDEPEEPISELHSTHERIAHPARLNLVNPTGYNGSLLDQRVVKEEPHIGFNRLLQVRKLVESGYRVNRLRDSCVPGRRTLDYPPYVLRRDLHHLAVCVVEDGDLVRVKKALRDDDAADCVGAVIDGNLDEDGKASG